MTLETSPPEDPLQAGLRRLDPRTMTVRQRVLAGLIAAPLLGAVLGLAFGPRLDDRRPMEPVPADRMKVLVEQAPNTPLPAGDGSRLDVLTHRPIVGMPAAPVSPSSTAGAPAVPVSSAATDAAATAPVIQPPPSPSRAGVDCDDIRSDAEADACADAELSAADRRMARREARRLDRLNREREWRRDGYESRDREEAFEEPPEG